MIFFCIFRNFFSYFGPEIYSSPGNSGAGLATVMPVLYACCPITPLLYIQVYKYTAV